MASSLKPAQAKTSDFPLVAAALEHKRTTKNIKEQKEHIFLYPLPVNWAVLIRKASQMP